MLWLYGWLMWCLQPLLKRKLFRRGQKESGYLEHIEQRFGNYPGLPASSGWIWVHAVSLGETRAAAILLRELRRLQPDVRVLLTHGTATGRAEGKKHLKPG
ncbi:glycosyltransferase N-terminal domain-containing protein, partial [Arthrospira platensis SPKY1]|nr:glycosyltransferase N-terminal domain-containing protein [Arthrospira platensis SPKY1]